MDFNEYVTHERTINVPVGVRMTRSPGRRGSWVAEHGNWRAEGTTEAAAVKALTEQMTRWNAMYRNPEIITIREQTAVLYLTGVAAGQATWSYSVIDPAGRQSSCGFSADTWNDAVDRVRRHLVQATTDWFDDASVHEGAKLLNPHHIFGGGLQPDAVREHYRYAAWQRAAKRAMDAGRADWHEWAGAHIGDFVIGEHGKSQ